MVREALSDLSLVDLTAKSEEGKTALDYARQWGMSEIEAELTKALRLTVKRNSPSRRAANGDAPRPAG